MKISLGWVPLDDDGSPYRPPRAGYSWQVGLTNPPRLYKTRGMAEGQSPVGRAVEAYAEVEE